MAKEKTTPPQGDAKPEAPATTAYTALTPIECDGVRYEPGETLEIDETTAAPLVAVRAIAAVPAAPAEETD